MQDWVAHLKHLQSILIKFDADCSLSEVLLRQYFYESFRPSIKLWINKEDEKQFLWDKLVKKSIKAKAKAKIQAANSQNLDQHCLSSNQLLNLINKE